MKQTRQYPQIAVTPKAQRSIETGHPWVYDSELVNFIGECVDGELVDVVNGRGAYLGTGLLNRRSKIRIRMISRNANDRFDAAFWERRIRYAWDYRRSVMSPGELCCCRVIFGEADFMPGLTVDRFGDVLVAQTLSLGIERIKPMLFPLLQRVVSSPESPIRGVYERNDVAIRELEGMEQFKGWFAPDGAAQPGTTEATITENGVEYLVDFENGQKTGFFLDQKYNRQAVARLSRGRRVLDCFTHTGSFALNAARGGAAHVTAVDVSESAVAAARENVRRNGFESIANCTAANVFDLLPSLESSAERYDFIILDPPAFTKSRKTIDSASRGYKEINLRAMRLLPRGGYLATCSCSHFMTEALFTQMLSSAASDAGVQLRQIESRQQSPDHPILWNVPETNYLKFFLFQIV